MLRALAWVGVLLTACGASKHVARFPARPAGCEVALSRSAPTTPTINIGPVYARCDDSIAPADCLRTLKDVVCRFGGDIVWGVAEEPSKGDGKNFWSGRAAHTK